MSNLLTCQKVIFDRFPIRFKVNQVLNKNKQKLKNNCISNRGYQEKRDFRIRERERETVKVSMYSNIRRTAKIEFDPF